MFQVEWESSALDGPADLCVVHRDRWAEINGAVDIIEYRLQHAPLTNGRHVAEGLHRIDSSPLALYFTMTGSAITIESVRWIG
jgi:hypothetical protein